MMQDQARAKRKREREALAKAEESAEMSDAPRGDGLRQRSEVYRFVSGALVATTMTRHFRHEKSRNTVPVCELCVSSCLISHHFKENLGHIKISLGKARIHLVRIRHSMFDHALPLS